VLATDITPAILKYAAKAATDTGFSNVTTRELDGEHLSVEEASFDAAISRVGLIYFPDLQAALASIRAALRPGGRLSSIVYSTADRNGFSRYPLGSSGVGHSCPHPQLGSLDLSASAAQAWRSKPSTRRDSTTSRSKPCHRRCVWPALLSVSASKSRSARCIRCCLVSWNLSDRQPGPRSVRHWGSSRGRRDLSRHARCWWYPAPGDKNLPPQHAVESHRL
jgi:SAM-dependent methyltransferase